MSGLTKRVNLQAKHGQIIISNAPNPRAGWKSQIKKEIENNGKLKPTDDYGDMLKEADATLGDGLAQ